MKQILLGILALSTALMAGNLVLAKHGETSPYSIVITGNKDDAMLSFISRGAQNLRQAVKNATGVTLPIVKDTEYQGGAPAIFIGNTRQLNALGLDTATGMAPWEHRILVRNRNVYLYGRDIFYSKRSGAHKGNLIYSEVGSLKAVCRFMEDFVNSEFIFPCNNNLVTLPMEAVTVPEDYIFTKVPKIQYIMGRAPQLDYCLGNGYLPPPWYGSYGGHSHNVAIPTAKYYNDHPEYFAIMRGKRCFSEKYPQYCYSNETVRELIYQEVLDHLDKGYDMVQLSQSDGFGGCECEQCRHLFGTEVKAESSDRKTFQEDPAFGEQLWIMHRMMAERLKKDRPGKKVCVLAYGATKHPPKTFSEFPDNMMIELCSYSKEFLAEWGKVKVPGGFAAYLYNWGFYNLCGLTPKSNIQELAEQVDDFIKFGVRGIYTCGFADVGGMDGAAIYSWLKRLDNPSLAPMELVGRYCKFAYLDAADEMFKFHCLVSERVKIKLDKNTETDWNDTELLSGTKPPLANNVRLLLLRYPDDVVNELDSLLKRAESKQIASRPQTTIFKILRLEMDYLKLTTHAINLYAQYSVNPTDDCFKELANTLQSRNALLASIPLDKNSLAGFLEGYQLFQGADKTQLQENGRLLAPIPVPLAWNLSKYLEYGINPANRVLETGGAESMLWGADKSQEVPDIWDYPLMLSATYDAEALHLKVTFPNNTAPEVAKRHIHVKLGNQGERKVFRFWANVSNGKITNYTVRTLTNAENHGKGDVYTPLSQEERQTIKRLAWTETASPDEKTPYVVFHIPWESFPELRHTPGSHLSLNVYSERPSTPRRDWLWAPNINMRSWRNRHDVLGTLILREPAGIQVE